MKKECPCCKQKLDEKFFYSDAGKRDGLNTYCKNCTRLRYREKRERNPAKFKEKDRKYYQKHKEAIKRKRKIYYINNQEKIKAREAVKVALFKGELVRKPCEVCGSEKTQAHHEDYSKKLDVNWLCAKHHRLRELGEV